jgi:hypothetical protein
MKMLRVGIFHELTAQVLGGEHVESRKRLVHEEHFRFDGEGAGESHTLLHAAGKLFGIGVLEALQTDRCERAQGLAMAYHMRGTAGEEGRFHVFQDREPGKQSEALKHDGNVGAALGHRLAVPRNFSCRRLREARKDSQQGGLPRSGRPQKRSDRARFQRQIGRGNHLNHPAFGLPKAFLDLPDGNDRLAFYFGNLRLAGCGNLFNGRVRFDRSLCRRSARCGKLVHQKFPGFLRQIVQKVVAIGGLHRIDDGAQFLGRARV